jgi:hypothetical protein
VYLYPKLKYFEGIKNCYKKSVFLKRLFEEANVYKFFSFFVKSISFP